MGFISDKRSRGALGMEKGGHWDPKPA